MSSHRNHSAKHALPNNPAFIDFPRSDGDSTLWPTNTTRIIDDEGCVNFMQPVPLDAPLSVKWRVGAGDAICVALKLPGGQPYVLRDFPDGYRMFDHHKGKADNPRHDVYLFGSESKSRFRSVPEFIPHAVWLMGDGSDVCKCKYCSKKPQREITSSMGNLLRHSNSPSPSRPTRPKAEKIERKRDVLSKRPLGDRLRDNKTYAAVQKSHNLPKTSPHIQTKHVMLVERNNNLRDACRLPSEGCLPRYFRDGELVWCALENPIMSHPEQPVTSPEEESLMIKYWPAIIDEVKLAIVRAPIPPDAITADNAATPWVTRQFTTYRVRFLGISQTYLLPDNMVIPYQSYLVPEPLLNGMAHRPIDDWDFTTEKLADFDPCPPPPGVSPSYRDALTTFALALQIASTVSTFWCVTDEWDAKLPLPPPTARPVPPPSSLQSAIEAAGSNNAYGGSISTGPIQIRAPAPAPPARVVTQVRFQGMWWGGERIWADDLVRLKVPRSCLAPAGAQHIFAPSPGGPKATALAQSRGRDPAEYGAIARGVFMRIDTIHILDANSQGKRECRVTGMLYELADIDWEDPNLPRNNVEALATQAPTSISAGISVSVKPGDMSSSYALPPAPIGFKFRPILAPGYEVVLCLSLISGRYYPRLLQHPQLKTHLNDVIPLDSLSMLSSVHLWSLEGLFGGYKNCVDPTYYKVNREKMLTDASKDALAALKVHVKDRQEEAARLENAATQMDTD
ncbi:hypothetical protein C8F04DRAFT_1072948 [Mycena alexandri]|uniref:Cryptic loci regulator 2 N-terminal domain-containing protein n=1 Tax=Mycena alexandri TaxID=1745969 RepID=A0AAD6TDK0_9AGAR|nr:hypothetical protein C8F04DRAFT_1072948 [Mycena alexandri]